MTDPIGTSALTSKKNDCVEDSGKWHAGRAGIVGSRVISNNRSSSDILMRFIVRSIKAITLGGEGWERVG